MGPYRCRKAGGETTGILDSIRSNGQISGQVLTRLGKVSPAYPMSLARRTHLLIVALA